MNSPINMENSNLRLRLEDYEFNEEQELKLTLELINSRTFA